MKIDQLISWLRLMGFKSTPFTWDINKAIRYENEKYNLGVYVTQGAFIYIYDANNFEQRERFRSPQEAKDYIAVQIVAAGYIEDNP